MSEEYFLGVHDKEIIRLGAQNTQWYPETETLWKEAGFHPGDKLIDLGCGPGFTTLDLAKYVGAKSHILAVDRAEDYLENLRKESSRHQINYISTIAGDITKVTSLGENFDGAFTRWFLAFLAKDIEHILQLVHKSLKPKGVFAMMEYLSIASLLCSPPNDAFDANSRAWNNFYLENGGDPKIGTILPVKLEEAGFEIKSINCVGGVAPSSHRWSDWWGHLIQDFGPVFVEKKLLKKAEWKALQEYWAIHKANNNAFIYTPLIAQIVAEKK